jgi:hypothetical protein
MDFEFLKLSDELVEVDKKKEPRKMIYKKKNDPLSKKEQTQRWKQNKKECQKDREFYCNYRNFAYGFYLLKEGFSDNNIQIPNDISVIIWEFVTMYKGTKLKNASKKLEELPCECCKKATNSGLTNCFNCGKNIFNPAIPRIILINQKTNECFSFCLSDVSDCLFNFGLIDHDTRKCEFSECKLCLRSKHYNLEHLEINYRIVRNEDKDFWCQLTLRANVKPDTVVSWYRKYMWFADRYDRNYRCKLETPEKNGDKYLIRDRKTFDMFMQHKSMVLIPEHCIICLNKNDVCFTCDGFLLCSDIKCHLTLGVVILKLGFFDPNIHLSRKDTLVENIRGQIESE